MKFLNALGFLTIVKIPQKFYLKSEEYPGILVYFPVAGLLVGILNAIVFTALNFFMPLFLSILIIAGFEVVMTGGIHVDGVADVFDGVFSGEKDKSRIMEIMKKGDIGVFGGLALLFSTALKISLLFFIAKAIDLTSFLSFDLISAVPVLKLDFQLRGFLIFILAVIFMPVFGRLSMLYLFSRHKPAAAGKSLSGVFIDKSNAEVFWLSVIYIGVLFTGVYVFTQMWFLGQTAQAVQTTQEASVAIQASGTVQAGQDIKSAAATSGTDFTQLSTLLLYLRTNMRLEILTAVFALKSFATIVFTFLFSAATGRFFTKRIGGLSGDIIGAVCVLTEVFFLLLYYIFLRLI
jgi:cobalamin synthase